MARWILGLDTTELEASVDEYRAAAGYVPDAISADYATMIDGVVRTLDVVRTHGDDLEAAREELENDTSNTPDKSWSVVGDYADNHCGPDGPLEDEPRACDRESEATALWGDMDGGYSSFCSAPTLAPTGDPFVYVDSTDVFVVLAIPSGLTAEPDDRVEQHGTLLKVTFPDSDDFVQVVLSGNRGWRLECRVDLEDLEEPTSSCSAHTVWRGSYDVLSDATS